MKRRGLLRAAAVSLSVPALGRVPAFAQDNLSGRGDVVVFSYGGSYTQGMRKNVYDAFTKATGINVVDVTTDFAEPQVKAMAQAGRVDWDVAIIDGQNLPPLDEAGLFAPIDYSLWSEESLKGTPQVARLKNAVVGYQTATVIAYNQRAFPSGGPKNWADFWNVKAFPGPRGLGPHARHNLVFALAADGVPSASRWPLTDDKLDRAFKKLDEIKPHIAKWWSAGGEPITLLMNREYAMTSCYDGRAIGAIRQGAPIRMVWDGGNLNYSYMTVLKGAPNSANAQKFIAFVNRAQTAAGFTQGVNLAGANTNQLQHLPVDMKPLLSINKENASKLTLQDNAWLAAKRPDGKTNADHIQERWLAWKAR